MGLSGTEAEVRKKSMAAVRRLLGDENYERLDPTHRNDIANRIYELCVENDVGPGEINMAAVLPGGELVGSDGVSPEDLSRVQGELLKMGGPENGDVRVQAFKLPDGSGLTPFREKIAEAALRAGNIQGQAALSGVSALTAALDVADGIQPIDHFVAREIYRDGLMAEILAEAVWITMRHAARGISGTSIKCEGIEKLDPDSDEFGDLVKAQIQHSAETVASLAMDCIKNCVGEKWADFLANPDEYAEGQ